MKQEQKELLLKDLCARLPYGVKVKTLLKEPYTLKGLFDTEYGGVVGCLLGKFVPNNVSPKTVNYPLEQFKPYLFPLSSMTKEQKNQLKEIWDTDMNKALDYTISGEEGLSDLHQFFAAKKVIDWFNKNHIDYRGLIPMGLANDATGLDIY